ncbi:MAG: hypothetical protein V7708_17370 [Oceanicoccus sp.]
MNILSPRLDTICAASFIGCAPSTLKISRVTGRLLGRAAPQFIKYGKKVVYDRDTLQVWIDQFGTRNNTAA